jgi:hypothetical protein
LITKIFSLAHYDAVEWEESIPLPHYLGKQGKTVEFGAQVSVSLTGRGLAHVDELHWNAQHESHDLHGQG